MVANCRLSEDDALKVREPWSELRQGPADGYQWRCRREVDRKSAISQEIAEAAANFRILPVTLYKTRSARTIRGSPPTLPFAYRRPFLPIR